MLRRVLRFFCTNVMRHQQKISRLPPEYDYIRGVLGDAIWLILSKVEEEEARRGAEIIPRELVLRIRLMPSEHELPVLVKERVSFGKAYNPSYASTYSSGEYALGTPRMYCDDPNEYWKTEASVRLTNLT